MLAGLFVTATAGVTFFLVGDLTETEPRYANYVWRPWPFLTEHEAVIGVVSMIVFVVAGAALVAKVWNGQVPGFLVAQVGVLAAFAAWLGFGYRVMTAGVSGAQLGAGLVTLATPVFALVTVALVVGLAMTGRRRRDRRGAAPD